MAEQHVANLMGHNVSEHNLDGHVVRLGQLFHAMEEDTGHPRFRIGQAEHVIPHSRPAIHMAWQDTQNHHRRASLPAAGRMLRSLLQRSPALDPDHLDAGLAEDLLSLLQRASQGPNGNLGVVVKTHGQFGLGGRLAGTLVR